MRKSAYMLGKFELGKEKEIVTALKRLECVEFVERIYGNNDFIAKITAQSIESLNNCISEHVKRIPGLEDTHIYIVRE